MGRELFLINSVSCQVTSLWLLEPVDKAYLVFGGAMTILPFYLIVGFCGVPKKKILHFLIRFFFSFILSGIIVSHASIQPKEKTPGRNSPPPLHVSPSPNLQSLGGQRGFIIMKRCVIRKKEHATISK